MKIVTLFGRLGHTHLIPLTLIGAICSPSGLAADTVAQHSVNLKPTKLAASERVEPKNVAISTDGSHMTVVLDTGQDVVEYLRNNQAHSIAQVWLDLDLNAKTGGKPFFSDVGGFEYSVNRIYICKEFKSGGGSGSVCAGDVPNAKFTKFYSSYSPKFWDASKENFKDIHGAFWKGGRGEIMGQKVRIKIPYKEFKGQPGQVVRVFVMAGNSQGSKYPEVKLKLK